MSKPIRTYEEHGVTVTVFPEKKVKRLPWQRGEAYLSMKMRLPDDAGSVMYMMTRKVGKY